MDRCIWMPFTKKRGWKEGCVFVFPSTNLNQNLNFPFKVKIQQVWFISLRGWFKMLLDTNYPWKFSGDYPPNPPECSSPKWNPGYATAFRAVRIHRKAVFQVDIGTYTPSVHLKILLFLFTNHWNSWALLQSLELILNYLVNLFPLLLLLRTSASTAFFSIKAYTSKLYDKYM